MKVTRFIAIAILLTTASLLAQSAEVRMQVSPGNGKRSIDVGDLFYITIEVVNSDANVERPANVPGAKVAYLDKTGTSSSFTSVNGHTTRSYSSTWTMTLRARSEGSYTFGPISVGGVKSNAVHYNIGKAMPSQSGGGQQTHGQAGSGVTDDQDDGKPRYIGHGDHNLFLRANVTKTKAYEQEALVYTVKLYTSYDAVKFIGATAAPKFDGFVVEESKDISTSLNYETYQGKTYASAIIARYIIFPQMTGNLKVSGNTYTISVDRREYYHDPFWGNMAYSQPLQLNVTPNDLTINVQPLPQPRPVDFSGGVGKFSIKSDLKGSEFKTNQTSSIVYTISGTGNLKYVQLPDLATIYPPQLEIYTPTTTQNVTTGSTNCSGNVVYDYSFMPGEEGVYKIPEIKLVYFNPETGQYETSVARGYTLNVGKGKGSDKSQVRKQLRFEPELEEINVTHLSKNHTPDIYKWQYWLWFIIPFVLLVGTTVGFYRYNTLHADMVAFNSRRADKLARRRLRRAEREMRRKNRDKFYDELLRALWGYLGDKLKMPTSELMRDNIRQVLNSRDIPEATTDRLIALIDQAEFAKYSSAGGDQSMENDYREAIEAINELEKSFKKKNVSGRKGDGNEK